MKFEIGDATLFRIRDIIRITDNRGDAYAIQGRVTEINPMFVHIQPDGDNLQEKVSLVSAKIREGFLNGTHNIQVLHESTVDERVNAGFYDIQELVEASDDAIAAAGYTISGHLQLSMGQAAIIQQLVNRLLAATQN